MVILRIAAAFLLSGWLLMIPPLEKNEGSPYGFAIRSDLPVTLWDHRSSHDQAKDCEEAKSRDFDEIMKNAMKASGKGLETQLLLAQQAAYARCVPADHIYPPKKPGN